MCWTCSTYPLILIKHSRLINFGYTQNAAGQVSFTNENQCGHMALTTHWIDNPKDKNTFPTYWAALSFHRLSGRHMGKNIANVTLSILDQAKITLKVKYIYLGWLLLSLNYSDWLFHNGQCQKQHNNDEKPWGTTTQVWPWHFWCQGVSSSLLSPHNKHLHWACHVITLFIP